MRRLQTWLAELLRARRVGHSQARARRDAAREAAAAEELQRVRDGMNNRFPPFGGMGGGI